MCPGIVPGAHIPAGEREYFRWRPAFRPQTRSSGPMTGPAFYTDDPFGPVIGPLDRVVSLHSKLLTCAAYRDYPFTRDRMSYNLRFVSVMFGIEELRELEPVPTKAY